MTIVRIYKGGKEYYQVRHGRKLVKHLGSEEKILMIFEFYETYKGSITPQKSF